MGLINLVVPDIGGSKDVNVAEIYAKVGDLLNKDDNVIMLETDKASMEVPSELSGIVKEICIKVGSKLNEGDVILRLEQDNKDKPNNVVDITAKDNSANVNFDESCDILVIGAGPGGYTAAFRAADLGKKVILVEKHSTLGGVCLNVGCIPSKALLHIAKVINDTEEMKKHGVSFGEVKIELDKIKEYKDNIVKKLTNGLTGLAKQRKVKVMHGSAKFTSSYLATVETADGMKTVQFSYAIIAVGSHSFKLPNFPFEDTRIIDSTGALSLDNIPKSMLVVGGGIIGLEMAEVYSTLGSEVSIVELGDSLIPSADKDLVKVLENRIKKKYKAIYTNTKCDKVEAKQDGIYITFNGPNDFKETHRYDKVLVAAGRRPNGNIVDADKVGVIVDDKGFIPVDKQCRTNVGHIFAIGDVVGQPMLAHKATHEGKIAAENCAGMKSHFDARTIPSVAYTDPEIAWMGLTEESAKQQNLEIEVGKFPWAASGRSLGNGREDGFTKVITDKKTHKILGAGIVGVNAGELLAEAVLALEMDCDIHDVALSIHAHPTLSETIAFACEMVDGSITDLYTPKKKI